MLLVFAGIIAGGALFVVLLFAIYQLANAERGAPRWSYAALALTIIGAIAMLSRWSDFLPFDTRHNIILLLAIVTALNALILAAYERGLTAKLTGVIVGIILAVIWWIFPAWENAS